MKRHVWNLLSLPTATLLAFSVHSPAIAAPANSEKDKKTDSRPANQEPPVRQERSNAENPRHLEIVDSFNVPTPDFVTFTAEIGPVQRVTDQITQDNKGLLGAGIFIKGARNSLEVSADKYLRRFADGNINLSLMSSFEHSPALSQCHAYAHDARLNNQKSVKAQATNVPYNVVYRDPDDIAKAKYQERWAKTWNQYVLDVLANAQKQNGNYKKSMDASQAAALAAKTGAQKNAHLQNVAKYKALIDANHLKAATADATYRRQIEDALSDARFLRAKHRRELLAALREHDKIQAQVTRLEAQIVDLKKANKTAEVAHATAGLKLMNASLAQADRILLMLSTRPHDIIYLDLEKHSARCL